MAAVLTGVVKDASSPKITLRIADLIALSESGATVQCFSTGYKRWKGPDILRKQSV